MPRECALSVALSGAVFAWVRVGPRRIPRESAASAAPDLVCHGFRLRCRMRSIDGPDGGQDLHSSAMGAKVKHPRKW